MEEIFQFYLTSVDAGGYKFRFGLRKVEVVRKKLWFFSYKVERLVWEIEPLKINRLGVSRANLSFVCNLLREEAEKKFGEVVGDIII